MKGVLGLDPGLSGGLAIIHSGGVITEPMPVIGNVIDKRGLLTWLRANRDLIEMAYLELSASRPKQSSQSTFTFGRGFGTLEMALEAAEIPYQVVPPNVWCKVIHAGMPKDMKAKDKSRIVAARLFPNLDLRESPRCKVPHEGMMDATLIASYGLRIMRGEK